MSSPPAPGCKRLRTDERFCPHCSKLLSYKTFRAHKRLYYDDIKDQWHQVSGEEPVESEDEIPPCGEEMEYYSTEAEAPPCLDLSVAHYLLEEGECDSPPCSEAGFSEHSEGQVTILNHGSTLRYSPD